MNKPVVSIIAALDEKRAIGKNNTLLWRIPEDLKHFKTLTLHHPVIMGRKTYESIGHLLPERTNIIVTRNEGYSVPGAVVRHSLEMAIASAQKCDDKEIFIIGGATIYQEAIKIADKLYLTLVEGTYEADAYFPDYRQFPRVLSRRQSSSGEYRYTFLELTR